MFPVFPRKLLVLRADAEGAVISGWFPFIANFGLLSEARLMNISAPSSRIIRLLSDTGGSTSTFRLSRDSLWPK